MITKKDVMNKCYEYAQILQMNLLLKNDTSETSTLAISDSLELTITEFETFILITSMITMFINNKKVLTTGPIYTLFKTDTADEDENITSHQFGSIIIYYNNFNQWINQLYNVLQQSQVFHMPIVKVEKIIKILLNEKTVFSNSTTN